MILPFNGIVMVQRKLRAGISGSASLGSSLIRLTFMARTVIPSFD